MLTLNPQCRSHVAGMALALLRAQTSPLVQPMWGLPTQSPHLWAALLLTLRIKQPLILPAKVELFGNGRELQYGTSKLEQNQANKGEEPYFIEKKDEVGRGCFEQWSFGKKARVLIG